MSTITREQAKDLRNAFQCWQQDYDPVEDKEQYDMFGLGVVAMDALLASLEAEPVGYVDAEYAELLRSGHIESCSVYAEPGEGCCPVYTSPPAPVSVPEWTNEQCLEFLSIAFRHAEIKGDLELDDIRLGVKMVNGSRAAMLQGADGALTDEDAKRVDELVMWIKRLAHSLRKANPDSKLQSDAMDYLSRKGLIGVEDILR